MVQYKTRKKQRRKKIRNYNEIRFLELCVLNNNTIFTRFCNHKEISTQIHEWKEKKTMDYIL